MMNNPIFRRVLKISPSILKLVCIHICVFILYQLIWYIFACVWVCVCVSTQIWVVHFFIFRNIRTIRYFNMLHSHSEGHIEILGGTGVDPWTRGEIWNNKQPHLPKGSENFTISIETSVHIHIYVCVYIYYINLYYIWYIFACVSVCVCVCVAIFEI